MSQYRFDGNLWVPLGTQQAVEIMRQPAVFAEGFGIGAIGRKAIIGLLREQHAIDLGRLLHGARDFAVIHIKALPVILFPDSAYETAPCPLGEQFVGSVKINEQGLKLLAAGIANPSKPHWDWSMKIYPGTN